MRAKEFIDESVTLDLAASMIPAKIRHWLKRTLHKDVYPKVIKLQHDIMRKRGLNKMQALVRAASTYGIEPREMIAVMDKGRRYN